MTEIVVIGLTVGFVVGLTGLGAGSVTTPLLILALDLRPAQAVSAALAVAAVTRLAGLWVHLRQRAVHGPAVALLAAGSLPASLAAGAVLWALGSGRELWIDYAVTAALLVSAVMLLLRAAIPPRIASPLPRPSWLVAGGAASGLATALSSIGAGPLGAAVMSTATALPAATIVGTNIAHGFLVALVSAGAHIWLQPPDPRIVFGLMTGSVLGAVAGGRFALRMPERPMRVALAAVALTGALRLV